MCDPSQLGPLEKKDAQICCKGKCTLLKSSCYREAKPDLKFCIQSIWLIFPSAHRPPGSLKLSDYNQTNCFGNSPWVWQAGWSPIPFHELGTASSSHERAEEELQFPLPSPPPSCSSLPPLLMADWHLAKHGIPDRVCVRICAPAGIDWSFQSFLRRSTLNIIS